MVRSGIATLAGMLLLVAFGWVNSWDNSSNSKFSTSSPSRDTRALVSISPAPLQISDESLAPVPNRSALDLSGTIYVPAYSTIRVGNGEGRPLELAVTLSLQNTSREKPLVLERLDFHDTAGQLVESYLQEPVALKPFGAVEVFIPHNDLRGGAGANFVVKWAAQAPFSEPIAEVMMIGTYGSAGFSFVSQGRKLEAHQIQAAR